MELIFEVIALSSALLSPRLEIVLQASSRKQARVWCPFGFGQGAIHDG